MRPPTKVFFHTAYVARKNGEVWYRGEWVSRATGHTMYASKTVSTREEAFRLAVMYLGHSQNNLKVE